ncbi:MAG: HD domain-containing protein [Candidatus Woesearchaeota archaeon]
MDWKIRSLILDLCRKKGEYWEKHVLQVVRFSMMLGKKLKADLEVLEAASWLHDIAKLQAEKVGHHISGAEEAEKILRKIGFKRINEVKHCILTHSSDKKYKPRTKEAKILASADALSHYELFYCMSWHAYKKKNLGPEDGRLWLIKKYNTAWSKLMPETRKMALKKHKAIMLILKPT